MYVAKMYMYSFVGFVATWLRSGPFLGSLSKCEGNTSIKHSIKSSVSSVGIPHDRRWLENDSSMSQVCSTGVA